MKKILFARHAHSGWGNNSLKDHDRPLSKGGESQALLMGERLNEKNKFDNVTYRNLSSGIAAIHSGWKI